MAYVRQYYLNYTAAHPGQVNAQRRKNYQQNREKNIAAVRAWQIAHPEERRQHRRDDAQRHRVRVYAAVARRSAQLKQVAVNQVDPQSVFRRDRWICQICHHRVNRLLSSHHRLGPTLDHIIPLVKGGEHSYANTQLAHRSCNSAKGAKLPISSPLSLGD